MVLVPRHSCSLAQPVPTHASRSVTPDSCVVEMGWATSRQRTCAPSRGSQWAKPQPLRKPVLESVFIFPCYFSGKLMEKTKDDVLKSPWMIPAPNESAEELWHQPGFQRNLHCPRNTRNFQNSTCFQAVVKSGTPFCSMGIIIVMGFWFLCEVWVWQPWGRANASFIFCCSSELRRCPSLGLN